MARKSIESSTVVEVNTPGLNGSAGITEWRFQVCAEDERRVYQGLVELVANGVPATA